MKRIKLKHILIAAAIFVASLFFFQFCTMHHSVFNNANNRHLFIFKDSVIENVNLPSYSWVAGQDTLTHFIFSEGIKNKKKYYDLNDTSNNYYIDVWEFNALKNYKLDDIFINEHSIIEKSGFSFKEVLNYKTPFPIFIKYFYKIDGLILNLGENSKVIKELQGKSYKGFYGLVDKMSICDKKGVPQIYFNFEKPLTPTVLILYKKHVSIFLIIIQSSKKLNENVIKILNLD